MRLRHVEPGRLGRRLDIVHLEHRIVEGGILALDPRRERHARSRVAAFEDRPFADHDLEVRVLGHQPLHVLEARLAIGALVIGELDQHTAALGIAEHDAGEFLEHLTAHLGEPLGRFLLLVGRRHFGQEFGMREQKAAGAVVGEARAGPRRRAQKAEGQRQQCGQQGVAQA